MTIYPVQTQSFALSPNGAVSGDTSITLQSFNDILGVPLTMASFGDTGFMVLEPNTSSEDSIVFTGITQNANGTATLTGVNSVGFLFPYTASSGLRLTHGGSVACIITNSSYFYYKAFVISGDTEVITSPYTFNNIVNFNSTATFAGPTIVPTPIIGTEAANKTYVDSAIATEDALVVHLAGTETITGAKTFTILPQSAATPVNNADLATKVYVDDTAVAGAPNANTTTKGIVQLSTAVQTSSGTATGSTGAALVPPNSLFHSISTGSTSVIVSNGVGKIDSSYLGGTLKFGGTGVDGALTISSGTTTINLANAASVIKNYTSISITGTGKLAFSNPHANGTIIILKSQGAVTITSSTSPCIDASVMGASGGNGGNTNFIVRVLPGNNGVLGSGASNGAGGATGTALGLSIFQAKSVPLACGSGGGVGAGADGSGGGGGAGGGGNSANNVGSSGSGGATGTGGSGGAGGIGGGVLYIECAGTYTNTSATLSATGGVGSNATSSGAGGGGGGGGGSIVVLYTTLGSDTGTYTVTGGVGGTGSSSVNGGTGAAGLSFIGLNTDLA